MMRQDGAELNGMGRAAGRDGMGSYSAGMGQDRDVTRGV